MNEFGGGLARFRDAEHQRTINNCREIVEVPGGPEWRIRRLQEFYSEYCWKYAGCSVIANYQFNRLKNQRDDDVDFHRKLFYAKVSHFMSPVEISLQPKYLSSARKRIMLLMNEYYRRNPDETMSKDQVFPQAACAVEERGVWHRGLIVQVSGSSHIVVELIDIGTEILVSRDRLKPLRREFGRAPPLCLKCRVDGITINDLETKDLIEFKNIVESCNALFRVQLKSVDEPFLIDIFHPTISHLNVCQRFLAPPEDLGKLERLQRSWIAHINKMENYVEDDEDDYWNHKWAKSNESGDNEILTKIEYIQRLDKCQRAPRYETDELVVAHIENAQLIYLQYTWQVEKRKRIVNLLKERWKQLHRLPDALFAIDQCCAIRLHSGQFRRCVITDVGERAFECLLIDFGVHVELDIARKRDLRLLPNETLLNEEPMVTIVSLAGAHLSILPHHSETLALRQLLKIGARVNFHWDKKSKMTPMRGLIFSTPSAKNIRAMLTKRLSESRQNLKCRELTPYTRHQHHQSHQINSRFVYRDHCHHHYSKGSAQFITL
ncbi:unnamed protein product [Caenorhabditis bovis]|uniref:Tudor domain-containing protein n=1 Tax=Caenorhabditis bovis TaxID=2654633 RepID=A0A8S1EB62_9PELO|nr:unnamed protein product [Caenorhabditis bovis]